MANWLRILFERRDPDCEEADACENDCTPTIHEEFATLDRLAIEERRQTDDYPQDYYTVYGTLTCHTKVAEPTGNIVV